MPPPEGAYRDSLNFEKAPVTRDECANYAYLVRSLVTSYIRLHGLLPEPQPRSRPSDVSLKSGHDICITDNDKNGVIDLNEDLETLRHFNRHVRGFQRHLRRVLEGSTLDFCRVDVIALQALALAMK